MSNWQDIPYYGSGIGFRHSLMSEILAAQEEIDFLEIISDNFFDDRRKETLYQICDAFPVIPHGVGLSVGSADGVEDEYLQKVKEVSDITRSPYYSEHLCHTRAPGIDIGNLSPLWFSSALLQQVIENVDRVQQMLGKRLVLENVSYFFEIPHHDMTQEAFFDRLVDKTGCGVLLDITNVYINALNHGTNATEFLDALPLDDVVQVHLAGGRWENGYLIDSHTESVQEGSWELLGLLLERTRVNGIVLEHDAEFPQDFSALTDQIARARGVMEASMVSA